MRVLVVNKFGFVRGGLERVMFDEIEALRALGHEAELFATAHPDNLQHRFASEFPPYHEIGTGAAGSASVIRDMFSNPDAAVAISRVIEAFRPDVAHFHGIHRHLSPSVLEAARAAGVPTVLTAHDYFAICPGNTLLRGGSVPCLPRKCGMRTFASAAVYRCVQHSLSRSVLAGAELSYQRLRRSYERGVDRLIAPSAFIGEMLVAGGFERGQVTVVPNAIRPAGAPSTSISQRSGFLYVGRLSPEKGIDVAVRAALEAGVDLSIAGDGPEAGRFKVDSVMPRLLGQLGRDDLMREIAHARAVVLPSLVPENAPMAVLEAMALGTPVIASAIGGIPEQIEDGVQGLLVPPGDVAALAEAMSRLASDAGLAERMGNAARERVEREFSLERHMEALLGVYRDVGAAS